jgi:hypothetical protein
MLQLLTPVLYWNVLTYTYYCMVLLHFYTVLKDATTLHTSSLFTYNNWICYISTQGCCYFTH